MRTVIVPTLCALALALAACGDDEQTATPSAPSQAEIDRQVQRAKEVRAAAEKRGVEASFEVREREGAQVLVAKSKKDAGKICKKFRSDGLNAVQGKTKFPIETPKGDVSCDLAKSR